MAREIEVKAKVRDAEALLRKLEELGCKLSEPVLQEDEVFNATGDVSSHPAGGNVLRIRHTNGKHFFALKRSTANELDCIEKELEVSEAGIMREIIDLLGFVSAVQVRKMRRKGNYGEYEICLDEVDGLGTFIEVEKMSDEDGEKVQAELAEFLVSLEVDPGNRVLRGYDSMIYEKIHSGLK